MKHIFSNKILLLFVGLIVAFGLWYGLASSSGGSSLIASDATTGNAATDPAGQEVVETLLALRAISLDGTIFQSPAFQSLQDFSTEIVQEPVGRPNPFAPLGAEPGSVQVVPGAPSSGAPTLPQTPPSGQ